jgi:hypothetical protein
MSTRQCFEAILAAKHREFVLDNVVEVLREGTDLSMSLSDFLHGITRVEAFNGAANEITLGDVFAALRPTQAELIQDKFGATGREGELRGAREGNGPRRVRANADLVAKRLDAIVEAVARAGGWVKPGEIYAEVTKKKSDLFTGVNANLMSQYLTKLAVKRPKRLIRRGRRPLTQYRVPPRD